MAAAPTNGQTPPAHEPAVRVIAMPADVLIGDVLIGPGCFVGPGAALRGDFGRQEYQALARRCLDGLSPCEPLPRVEPERRRLAGSYAPLSEARA